jgi:hypothetical protein
MIAFSGDTTIAGVTRTDKALKVLDSSLDYEGAIPACWPGTAF